MLKFAVLSCGGQSRTYNLILNKMAYRITEDCAACGTCLPECPVGAISEGDIYVIDPNACTDCGTCADACPMGAIVAGE